MIESRVNRLSDSELADEIQQIHNTIAQDFYMGSKLKSPYSTLQEAAERLCEKTSIDELLSDPKIAHTVLHHLWSKCVGLDRYDKGAWMSIQMQLFDAGFINRICQRHRDEQ